MKLRLALLLALASAPAFAKVDPVEAEQLRNRLTPLGAERAGSEDGAVPPWTGGLVAPPPCYRAGARYCNPYPDDEPLARITVKNLDQWRDWLGAGQVEALLRYPDTYSVTVFPTHRSAANPGAFYEATFRNAKEAKLSPSANGVIGAGAGIPFPIPKNGVEPIWNHKMRWRGVGLAREVTQAATTATGEPAMVRLREDVTFPFAQTGSDDEGTLVRWLDVVLSPDRLKGTIYLIRDTLDPATTPPRAQLQTPDLRQMRNAQSYGYDNPGAVAEDLRFDDQVDGFFGATDRYLWRLAGKREMVVPYNSYVLHAANVRLRDLIRPGHLDPRFLRYEVHRVWVVESTVRPGLPHRYKRRTFYLDEDSWQILMVDVYDSTDTLWRWQEIHTVMAYDRSALLPSVETVVDLKSGRMLVQGPDLGDAEAVEKTYPDDFFSNSNARSLVPR